MEFDVRGKVRRMGNIITGEFRIFVVKGMIGLLVREVISDKRGSLSLEFLVLGEWTADLCLTMHGAFLLKCVPDLKFSQN